MAISTYLLTINLNINGLNTPIKRHRVTKWIKKTGPVYMLLTRDSPQTQRHAQIKSQGMEKDISCKQQGENTSIRQNRLQNKESNKR